MSQQLFKEFVVLFKSWPVDATKQGRCLGEHIRRLFNRDFKQGELSEGVDIAKWTRIYQDLRPLANNEILAKYPRARATGALGLGREQCKLIMSNTAQKYMAKDEE